MIFKVADCMAGQQYVVHPHNHIRSIFVSRLFGEVQAFDAVEHQTFKQVAFNSLVYLTHIARLEIMQHGLSVGNGVFNAFYLILISASLVIIVWL